MVGAERVCRVAVSGLVVAAASVAIVRLAGPADARPRPTLAANRALAQRIARELIAHVPLPPGAAPVPSNPGSSVWLGSSVSGIPGIHVDDVHRFWRAAGAPKAVFDRIRAHPPPGSHLSGSGTGAQNGTVVAWFATFSYPPVAGQIADRGIGVGVTAGRDGGTAIRADAFAQWLIPRSPSEVVPAGTRRVAVSIDRLGGRGFPVRTVTSRRAVARLRAFVDSRPVVQSVHLCPAVGPFSRVLDLRFEGARGGAPLARAVEDACGDMSFFHRGHRERSLLEGADLSGLLWTTGVLPVCRAGQLSATAGRPSRQPRAILAELVFRDVSARACALRGFGRVRLIGADGRTLRPPVRHPPGPAGVALLTPSDRAVIALSWAAPSRSCRGPRPVAIEAALPGPSGRYRLGVSSWPRRLAPCRSAIVADALS